MGVQVPLSAPNSKATQTLTITGTGFTPDPGLRVVAGHNGAGSYPVLSATATQIQVQINPGKIARTWLVEAIDSNGAVSNVATFHVQ